MRHARTIRSLPWLLLVSLLPLGLDACSSPGHDNPAPIFAPSPCGGDSNPCGLEAEIVPDFELVDLNTSSATYEQSFSRDDFLGKVLVVYWATAT